MTQRTMRKYLKKPTRRAEKTLAVNWTSLQHMSLQRAQENGVSEDDPRLRLLKSVQENPERILRRLSILSVVDIDREFGPRSPQ